MAQTNKAKEAAAKKAAEAGVTGEKPAAESVSLDQFEGLMAVVGQLAQVVTDLSNQVKASQQKPAKAPKETPLDKEVARAAPNASPMNPDWELKAREILGDALDYCEVQYLRKGGTIFTVVIKPSHSNAPLEYLERMKQDRRSKEIGQEGEEGVVQWCKLVAQNLKRARTDYEQN